MTIKILKRKSTVYPQKYMRAKEVAIIQDLENYGHRWRGLFFTVINPKEDGWLPNVCDFQFGGEESSDPFHITKEEARKFLEKCLELIDEV